MDTYITITRHFQQLAAILVRNYNKPYFDNAIGKIVVLKLVGINLKRVLKQRDHYTSETEPNVMVKFPDTVGVFAVYY